MDVWNKSTALYTVINSRISQGPGKQNCQVFSMVICSQVHCLVSLWHHWKRNMYLCSGHVLTPCLQWELRWGWCQLYNFLDKHAQDHIQTPPSVVQNIRPATDLKVPEIHFSQTHQLKKLWAFFFSIFLFFFPFLSWKYPPEYCNWYILI